MSDVYEDVKRHFAERPEVIVNEGRGAQGLKFGKKMFVMFYKGNILAILPPERVDALVAEGLGTRHDPGTGTEMKDRLLVSADRRDDWIAVCEESLETFKNR